MEIEVGEYVRTKDCYIGKVVKIRKNNRDCDTYYSTDVVMASGFYEHIVKHSKNIIDLIEVGDYVNGHKILEVKQNLENGLRYLMYDYVPMEYYVERTDKIKSIVTKEQFKSLEYEIN